MRQSYFWFKYDLHRSTSHPKYNPTGVRTHDLPTMDSTFHVPEMLTLTTEPPGPPSSQYEIATLVLYASDGQVVSHSTKKPVTTMLTYPWKCTVLHCNHLGNTWKPLVLMTRHFDYCPSASEGDNQSVRSSAPVVSRCFPGGSNVKLYISRGRLAWWLLAFLHSVCSLDIPSKPDMIST